MSKTLDIFPNKLNNIQSDSYQRRNKVSARFRAASILFSNFRLRRYGKNRTEPCLVSFSLEQRESQNGTATVQRAACNSSNESPRESLGTSVPSTYKTTVARTNGIHRWIRLCPCDSRYPGKMAGWERWNVQRNSHPYLTFRYRRFTEPKQSGLPCSFDGPAESATVPAA